MFVCHFAENTSEVGSKRKISAVFKILYSQWFHVIIYSAAVNIITQNKIAGCPSMVSSAGSILMDSTSEFRHRHKCYIILICRTQIIPESGDAITKIVCIAGKNSQLCTLVKMCIPPA